LLFEMPEADHFGVVRGSCVNARSSASTRSRRSRDSYGDVASPATVDAKAASDVASRFTGASSERAKASARFSVPK
jgi:hypothetical protein